MSLWCGVVCVPCWLVSVYCRDAMCVTLSLSAQLTSCVAKSSAYRGTSHGFQFPCHISVAVTGRLADIACLIGNDLRVGGSEVTPRKAFFLARDLP